MYLIFIINFLLAIATTIGMTIIPFLVTDSLGLSLLILGLIEGTTEFLSNLLRLTNGILFDNFKNKRIIFVSSIGMAFIAKLLLLMPSTLMVICSKTLERVSNGAFAAPRDAYVAEKAKNRGLALGLLGFSKSAGCILGPLTVSISTLFLGNLKNNLGSLVIFCCLLVLPAFMFSFTLNVKALERSTFSVPEIRSIFKKISPILGLIFLFFLGRFNDGLLMMYLKEKSFPEWFYLSTISVFNFTMLIVSPIIGSQIDRGHLKKMLYMSIIALGIFGICFYQLNVLTWSFAILGLIAWGIQRTGAQIVFASLTFNSVDKAHYGTAIGLFYIVSGFATMLSSFFCGYMTQIYFPAVFILSTCCSISALVFAVNIFNNHLPLKSKFNDAYGTNNLLLNSKSN
jgi:MFS family permease